MAIDSVEVGVRAETCRPVTACIKEVREVMKTNEERRSKRLVQSTQSCLILLLPNH